MFKLLPFQAPISKFEHWHANKHHTAPLDKSFSPKLANHQVMAKHLMAR
jgi:hypothetical protein